MPPKEDPGVLIDSIPTRERDSSSMIPTMTKRIQLSDVAMAKSTLSQRESSSKRPQDVWWIHGKGYDLDSFVERHPGGREAILLGKGRDCTALVESYHAFSSQQVARILEKYLCQQQGGLMMKGSENTNEDFFYDILKRRVADVLKSKGIDPIRDRGASWMRMLYYVVIVLAVIATGYAHVKGSVWGSFGFAVFGWLMGSLGHDAGHFAASHKYPQINEWGVWAMCLICNPIMWQHQHTYGHHSFTNEINRDPDVHHFDWLIRVHKGVPQDPKYKSQTSWLYILFAYSFVVFGTAFYIPITMIQSGSLYGMVDWHDKDRPAKAIGMRLHNLCYFLVVMVAPFVSHASHWTALGAVALHIATLGILFGIFSQVNHLNEASLQADMQTREQTGGDDDDSSPNKMPRDPRLIHSWAASQVETSNNFATQSWLWHLLSNGLNHQIEHHLFPGLNHAHLHHIAPVVRQTCEEYRVNYKSFETWADIMNATLCWYSQLSGVDDNFAEAKSE